MPSLGGLRSFTTSTGPLDFVPGPGRWLWRACLDPEAGSKSCVYFPARAAGYFGIGLAQLQAQIRFEFEDFPAGSIKVPRAHLAQPSLVCKRYFTTSTGPLNFVPGPGRWLWGACRDSEAGSNSCVFLPARAAGYFWIGLAQLQAQIRLEFEDFRPDPSKFAGPF